MSAVISIRNFAKSFGKLKAATDISFTVHQGDIYGFLGRNGAGKSTTIRAMLTLIKPDSGDISIFNKDLKKNRSEILRKIGSIVEKPDFYKFLSAKRNLEVLSRGYPQKISASRIQEMLEFTGLKGRENDKVGGYSHGMRQRLGIAQALLHNPDLIILDEPTTGLDPQGIIDIRNLILQLRDKLGKTIILSSHLLAEVELICNRMVIIEKGKTLIEGKVADLLNTEEVLVEFKITNPLAVIDAIKTEFPGNKISVTEDSLVVLTSHARIPVINNWLTNKNIDVYGIQSKRKLEDYFLKILQQDVSAPNIQ